MKEKTHSYVVRCQGIGDRMVHYCTDTNHARQRAMQDYPGAQSYVTLRKVQGT